MHAANRWITGRVSRRGARLRLFCFGSAGSGAAQFLPWADLLPPGVELCPVERPGRGLHAREPAIRDLPTLAAHTASAIASLPGMPFAFYGHSLGGILAFEVARELRRRGQPTPALMLVASATAPGWQKAVQPLHRLSDDGLIDELRRLGGTPDLVLDDRSLIESFMAPLRADFEAIYSYRHEAEAPLDVPVAVYGGQRDRLAPSEGLQSWREHSSAGVSVEILPGGHFFPSTHRTILLQLLSGRLGSVIPVHDGPTETRAGSLARLEKQDVDLWRIDLAGDEACVAANRSLLSKGECARADGYLVERVRRRFILARGAMRSILGHYTNRHPREIRFEYGKKGKPSLCVDASRPRLGFNLSHSDSLGVMAVCRDRAVGVDVERVREDVDVVGLCRRFFSAEECERILRLEAGAKRAAFFETWTRKEAMLKARGDGVAELLDRERDTDAAESGDADTPGYVLETLDLGRGWAGALAVEGTELVLRERHPEGVLCGAISAPAQPMGREA